MNQTLAITNIAVNMTATPLGIDSSPYFSWTVTSALDNNCQTAYRIKVYSKNKILWDSDKTQSSASTSVTYGGSPLASTTTYYVKITVWDRYGNTAESAPKEFRTGIFVTDPWQGEWITAPSPNTRAAILMRKEFKINKPIAEATVYMSGLGSSRLKINGILADDCFLDPCNTQYSETVLYRCFDVAKLLSSENNAIAIELGNGFFNEEGGVWNWAYAKWKNNPMLLFYMIIEYTDGTKDTILSDATWKVTTQGPTTFNSIYYGESYDARLEKAGWDRADYDDSAWQNAIIAKAPKGKLECQTEEPVRRAEHFTPQKIEKRSDGSYIVYCPEMVAGWIRLKIKNAERGRTVTIRYGEKLSADGSVQKMGAPNGVNSHWWREKYIMTDQYTAKGELLEVFEPQFSYKGFAYIQIFNYPHTLTKDDIEIFRIRNTVKTTGYFETSNQLINALHQMMQTTILNNLQGKPTDTPVWEKNGWLGDFNVGMTSMTYNYDMRLMTENFVEIMESCFNEYGLVPPMVPTANWSITDHFVWSSVYLLAVWELYQVYGTRDYMIEQYDSMKQYAIRAAGILSQNSWVCSEHQLGDWVSPMGNDPNAPYVESPSEGSSIVGTAMLYLAYDKLAAMAELLEKKEDASLFRGYMANIFTAFNQKFYLTDKGYYQTSVWNQHGNRTHFRQSSQILPLAVGLVPSEHKKNVISSLITDIKTKGNHLDTGCVGTKFLLPLLCDSGYSDLAYQIVTQTTYPSWGFMIENGATSLWEMWELTTRSVDHYFLGTYEEWFYSHLAGIKKPDNGYESFTVQPHILGDLTYVTCKLNTVRGEVESSWTKTKDGSVTMKVTVPFGSTATVIFPLESATVNGEAVTSDRITLPSGTYEIVYK